MEAEASGPRKPVVPKEEREVGDTREVASSSEQLLTVFEGRPFYTLAEISQGRYTGRWSELRQDRCQHLGS